MAEGMAVTQWRNYGGAGDVPPAEVCAPPLHPGAPIKNLK